MLLQPRPHTLDLPDVLLTEFVETIGRLLFALFAVVEDVTVPPASRLMRERRVVPDADAGLRRLQKALRTDDPPEEGFHWQKEIPRDLVGEERKMALMSRAQVTALAEAEAAVADDVRFEHLENRQIAQAVWYFAASCLTHRTGDLVPRFVEANGKEVRRLVCYMPVLNLSVDREEVLAGLTLYAPTDERVSKHRAVRVDTEIGAFAVVPVEGTSYGQMYERARREAEHGLRKMRVALRAHRDISDTQLRFELGTTYSFGERGGVKSRPDVAHSLGPVNDELRDLIASEPVSALPLDNATDIQQAANRAAAWLERAQFAGDPLIETLYAFFALETLVGDKASGAKGTKGHVVAYRQALLGSIVTGGFTHPDDTLLYYDEVRSNAVHGSVPMEVDEQTSRHVAWGVRVTLKEFLTLANDLGLLKRSKLLAHLKGHEDEPGLREFLRLNGDEAWKKYLDVLDEEHERASAARQPETALRSAEVQVTDSR